MLPSQHDRREGKGRLGSSCCATGALRPGVDREMAVKFYLNRSTCEQAFVKYSHLDQVVLLVSNETAIRIKTDEVAGTLNMEKLTVGRRYAVVTFLRRPMNHFFYDSHGASDRFSDSAVTRAQNLAPDR